MSRKAVLREVAKFANSFSFDSVLLPQDLALNRAWAEALRNIGILSRTEEQKIVRGLDRIGRAGRSGRAAHSGDWEDVHSYVEITLHKLIGDAAKKLHTGKSRNDQVATDLRMYVIDRLTVLDRALSGAMRSLLVLADRNVKVIFPSYTHLRQAQPVLFAHIALAYFSMLKRDRTGLGNVFCLADELPLGSAAVGGTAYAVDRKLLARRLGFSRISSNSIDAVGDRDFVIQFHAWGAQLMAHLSRISEDLILWSSDEWGFIQLPAEYCTGSSLLPQKLNPDVLELIRGKTARVVGNAVQSLALVKGLPTSYSRDLQEDKESLFSTAETVESCLKLISGLLGGLRVDARRSVAAMSKGFVLATDLADALVERGVPFREAHGAVSAMVRWCIENDRGMKEVPEAVLREISTRLDRRLVQGLSLEASVRRRSNIGGTSPSEVRRQIREARKDLLKG